MKAPLLALLGSAAYATARYHVFKGVPWEDWPIYTLNKAFAIASLGLLVFSVIRKRLDKEHSDPRNLYMASLFGIIHVFLSLILLSPAYYEKLFAQGKLTAAAGLSMALGGVAAALMFAGKRTRGDQPPDGGVKTLTILAFVIGLHSMLQGSAWFAPSQWPGLMPPLTLIGFLLGLAAVAVALLSRRTA